MSRIQTFFFSLLFLVFPVISGAEDSMPLHTLQVKFDIEKNRLLGRSSIELPAGTAWTVHIEGLTVTSAHVQGTPLGIEKDARTISLNAGPASTVLTVEYEVSYGSIQKRGREDGIETANLVSPEGIALINGWYPSVDGLARFRLSAVVPQGFEGISEADEIIVKERVEGSREFSFAFGHPVESINFIAGRYELRKEQHKAVAVHTYFFPEERELAANYLEQAKKYITMYEDLIGPFPFKRFSVVENILPTGYSMPTFTLLGRDVVRLPFIVETSLGHEILHQWFGNSVYVDRTSGNWSEGLTTYLADHQYEDLKGKGPEYRKQILAEYQSQMTPEKEFALKDFSSRTDRATASLGYGKTAMVFHALKGLLGQDLFRSALKEFYERNRFRPASWQDLQKAFETVSAKNLDWFFKQWVQEKGALGFDVRDVMVGYEGSKARISFGITQETVQRFQLPVMLKTDKGEIRKVFDAEKESATFEIETLDIPLELVIDQNYDLFRKLTNDEVVPVVSMLLGDQSRIFVLPKGREKDYDDLADFLKEHGFATKKEEDLKYEDIKGSSLLVPHDAALLKRLYATVAVPEGDFALVMKQNPYSRKSVIAVISALPGAETGRYLRRITHYAKYSTLVFKNSRNITRTIDESEQGIRVLLANDIPAVEVPRLTTANQIVDKAGNKDIVYVGEHHDRFDHHRLQYQVIRELHKKNKKLAIGMEMFQKPFQKALDDYISGTIDEKTFLKKSEYFKRWGFDYNLYREILLFAHENKIPVIALNIRKEIVTKVSKEGLQALSAEDVKDLPAEMDLSDMGYRERLRGYFERHAGSESRNFDFFYQSQVLWDESMAHNLNDFMVKNPGYQIVVLTGGGHMAFGSGIPKRAHRLNGKDYVVILNSDDVEKDVADYILYPSPLSFPESLKLMVILKEEKGSVSISGFSPESIAEKAGLTVDDIILSLDNEKIEAIEDIKIHLFYRKKGDTVTVKVARKSFLFGIKELEFKVAL
ncbi:MAG: ChaN family lipoprotein [Nitrospirae bacterium]|nr:ChaN family lipoprotein [Nitrospirota bacterium]